MKTKIVLIVVILMVLVGCVPIEAAEPSSNVVHGVLVAEMNGQYVYRFVYGLTICYVTTSMTNQPGGIWCSD